MPANTEMRLLAQWRQGPWAEDLWQSLGLLFRRALVCAGLVMFCAIAWSLAELSRNPENAEALANYELRADLMP